MRKFAIRLMRSHFFIPAFPGIQCPKSLYGCCQKQDVQDGEDFRDYRVLVKVMIWCLPEVMFPVASTIWRAG